MKPDYAGEQEVRLLEGAELDIVKIEVWNGVKFSNSETDFKKAFAALNINSEDWKDIRLEILENGLYMDSDSSHVFNYWLNSNAFRHKPPVMCSTLRDENGKLVGWAGVGVSFKIKTKEPFGLFNIFVQPEYRGKGQAKKLTKDAIVLFKNQSNDIDEVFYSDSFRAAESIIEQEGFYSEVYASMDLKSTTYTLRNYLESKHKVELNIYFRGSEDYKSMHISSIKVPKNERGLGIGSKVMKEIIDFADKNELICTLSPSRDFGASSMDRLRKFYGKFGFVRNLGRNKDYRFMEAMIRKPNNEKTKTMAWVHPLNSHIDEAISFLYKKETRALAKKDLKLIGNKMIADFKSIDPCNGFNYQKKDFGMGKYLGNLNHKLDIKYSRGDGYFDWVEEMYKKGGLAPAIAINGQLSDGVGRSLWFHWMGIPMKVYFYETPHKFDGQNL
jgi:GNAT superfamily N-acetyltransferase